MLSRCLLPLIVILLLVPAAPTPATVVGEAISNDQPQLDGRMFLPVIQWFGPRVTVVQSISDCLGARTVRSRGL